MINSIKTTELVYRPTPQLPKETSAAPKGDFGSYLKDALGEVNELQGKASEAIQQMVGEGKGDLQDTMIALEKADVSFRLMMQIRNKVLDAYQEIMRMQV
jgi:flagellar hook-basal body complex protein FliE